MARGLFVTGTDTGVGKTLVAAALLRGAEQRGWRAVGMKPVAAGELRQTEDGMLNADVIALRNASNVRMPHAQINPYAFAESIAPHIGAQRAGMVIDRDRICGAFDALALGADLVVVEGAGGFLVPLGPRLDFADLAAHLALPVVLVVGLRLGCLNHALLTQEAILARGLPLAGWVGNCIDPRLDAVADNIAALRSRLRAPLLATIAWHDQADQIDLEIDPPGMD